MNGENRSSRQQDEVTADPPRLVGIHHVRVPVTDLGTARDWYVEVLGFTSVLEYEVEDALVGISLTHPSGFTVGLHHAPVQAEAMRGFVLFDAERNVPRAGGYRKGYK